MKAIDSGTTYINLVFYSNLISRTPIAFSFWTILTNLVMVLCCIVEDDFNEGNMLALLIESWRGTEILPVLLRPFPIS